MGERGGWVGDPPPLASKNLSPPLEPKIRDLQKFFWPKEGGNRIFLKKNSFCFRCFKSEELTPILFKKTGVFFLAFAKKSQFSPAKIWFVPPSSPPLPLP